MDYENVIKRGSDAELTFRRHEALLESVSITRGLRQVFKGLGGTGIWKYWRDIFNWRTLELDHYGKRLQQQIFLDNGHFSSRRVPVFDFWLCSGLWFHGGWRLWVWVQLDVKVLSSVPALAA